MAVSQSQPQTRLVKRVQSFTGTTTWTVPAGVTFVKVTLTGGGGGGGGGFDNNTTGAGQSGAATTFVHASVTSSAPGGLGARNGTNSAANSAFASPANSGVGGSPNTGFGNGDTGRAGGGAERSQLNVGLNGQTRVFGRTVTPGGTATITIGAGGAGGASPNGAAGGTGYAVVEYEQEVFV